MCYMLQLAGIIKDWGSGRVLTPACTLGLGSSVALTAHQTLTNVLASKSSHVTASNLHLETSSKALLQESELQI